MGNFCTQCGRPLQDGEICNCSQNGTTQQMPQQPVYQQVPPQQQMSQQQAYQQVPPQQQMPTQPSATSIEIRKGFSNLLEALKKIWTNPVNAAIALSHPEDWLPALVLIVAQALFSGFFALATFGVGIGADDAGFLAASFFFTFFASLAISAATAGMYLGIGKVTDGTITFKSALSIASIRCFVCVPLTFVGMLLGMLNIGVGLFLFVIGELIAILLTVYAVQESCKLNQNRTFLVVGCAYLVMFILFVILAAIFVKFNVANSLFGFGSSFSSSYYNW